MKKKDYYGNEMDYAAFFLNNEFEDDIVFARFINYMKLALYHRKINYDMHQEFLNRKEEKLNYRGWSVLSNKISTDHSFFILNQDYDKLNLAISKLTEKQRYVIVNYYYKHKSLAKIAKKMNTNVDAVNHLKYRAILSLRRFLED